MPPIPRTSPSTSLPTSPSFIHTTSFSFIDTHGRTLLLRGVNLSGASKAPVGRLSHVLEGFWESAGAPPGEGDEGYEGGYGGDGGYEREMEMEEWDDDAESVGESMSSRDSSPGASGSGSGRHSPKSPPKPNPTPKSKNQRHTQNQRQKEKQKEKLSFINRPLNIDDGSADVHLARLRGWGFNLLRFPFTWEALEHEGPGKYDYEYMDYLIRCLVKCKEYGFRVYMDPHQDTWSRFSGGSGAPYWTLPACGINPRHITATQAALLHCEYPTPYRSSPSPPSINNNNSDDAGGEPQPDDTEGEPPQQPDGPDPASLPAMSWSTNYGRLLSQTVFTLFFAGRDFAPKCIIDGVNIQDYLQSHFINACAELAKRIASYDAQLIASGAITRGEGLLDACVIGWDSLNEPFEGLVGWADVRSNPGEQGSTLKKGTYPTPAQSMRLGMGMREKVEHWSFSAMGPKKDGWVDVDPKGRRVWADPVDDPVADDGDESGGGGEIEGELKDGRHTKYGWTRDVSKWTLGTCIWAQHGVWDIPTGYVLRPDYFAAHPSTANEVEFLADYWKPHFLAFSRAIREHHPEAVVFVQPPVFAVPPRFAEEELRGRAAYSPHYYDGLTLVTRHWNWFNADALGLLRGKYKTTLGAVKLGESAIRKSLHEQLGYLQADVSGAAGTLGGEGGRGYPTVIGEIGTPFDMDGKRSYGWTEGGKWRGDYTSQEKALDASLQACDAWVDKDERDQDKKGGGELSNKTMKGDSLNWTVWTYVPDDHSHAWGDGWNMEDLSLWSVDDLVGEECEEGGEGGEEGGEGEEALHSRAGLLGDGERERDAAEQLHQLHHHRCRHHRRCRCVTKDKDKAKAKKTRNKQMERSLPMTAALSSLSVATLGSSTSLGSAPGSGVIERRRRRGGGDNNNRSRVSLASRTSTRTSSSSSTRNDLNNNHKHDHKHEHDHDPIHRAQLKAGYHTNPFTFLTNGARAVRAFSRPFPVAVVGRAVDVRFDVAKSVFRLVVWVGWEDAVVSREGDAREGGGEKEEVATEVFIPLVHYAHARLLDRGYVPFGAGVEKGGHHHHHHQHHEDGEEDVDEDVVVKDTRTKGGYPPSPAPVLHLPVLTRGSGADGDQANTRTTSTNKDSLESSVATLAPPPPSHPHHPHYNQQLTPEIEAYTPDLSTLTMNTPLMAPLLSRERERERSPAALYRVPGGIKRERDASHTNTTAPTPTTPTPSPSPTLLIQHPDLLDIEVTLSPGTSYSITGQTLKWWYPVPSKGEVRREYVMEVRRRGGVVGRGRYPGSYVWRRGGGEKGGRGEGGGEEDGRGCCESLCDEQGCVIA